MSNKLKPSFKQNMENLNFTDKVVGIGAFLLFLSAILPWYKDIDKFRTGDMFLGITGPLYMAGFLVLTAGLVSFLPILFKFLNKPFIKLPVKPPQLFIFSGAISLLMILLASSVYFHTKFGVNIMEKTAGVGLIMAFASSFLVLAGGMFKIKNEASMPTTQKHLASMIDMGLEDREPGSLSTQREKLGLTPANESQSTPPVSVNSEMSANRSNIENANHSNIENANHSNIENANHSNIENTNHSNIEHINGTDTEPQNDNFIRQYKEQSSSSKSEAVKGVTIDLRNKFSPVQLPIRPNLPGGSPPRNNSAEASAPTDTNKNFMGASGFRTPFQQSMPDSYFSKDAFTKKPDK